MKSLVVAAILAVLISGCGAPQSDSTSTTAAPSLPAGIDEASSGIDSAGLLASVTEIASDENEGRFPGSRGDIRARGILASRLAELGLEPAFGEDEWQQPLTIVGITSHMPEAWEFAAPGGESVAFRFADEYMGGSGVHQERVEINDAEVVFVGYGIEAPEEQWDDFKGADLTGKVLLMLNDDPDWDPDLFAGERKLYYGRWTAKYEAAARKGAAGAIIIHTAPSAGYPWQVVRSSGIGEQFELEAGDEARIQVNAWLTEDGARRLVGLTGHDLDALIESARSREFQPVPLAVTTSMAFSAEVRPTETANVGGILRGSDPALADELVIYSAHHDHFGIGEPDETGDTIYNGALDNGVAMAQVLAIAKAFTALPTAPRRSIMFLFVAAEEQSLLGSKFFAESGAYHPGKMAANINIELGNVWGPTRDVMVYGKGKSEIDELLLAATTAQDRVLVGDTDVHAGWFYRSDQFSFARVGVPAIWFKSGIDFEGRPAGWGEARYAEWIDRHYHQPSDEVTDEWVFEGLVEDARLAFAVGAALATRDEMPAWVPGDEFEAARLEALADAR